MNKHLLAAGLTLAMTSTGASAFQGIQIDPTGSGNIGSSFIANNLGSDFGDMLLQSLVSAVGGNSGTIFAHDVFDLGSLNSGEITFVMWMDAESSPAIDGFVIAPNVITLTNPAGGASYFALYYDPLDGSGASGIAVNHDTGAGYDDGVLLALGTVQIDLTVAGASSLTATLDRTVASAPLDTEPGSIMTAAINGNLFLNVEFTSLPGLGTYLINDLVTLSVDMEVNGGLRTPYEDRLASDVVGGAGGASLNPGADNENDFTCSIAGNQGLIIPPLGDPIVIDQDCDVQVQIVTALDFQAETVPEPTTLGLIGAGLGLAGYFSRRRKSAV